MLQMTLTCLFLFFQIKAKKISWQNPGTLVAVIINLSSATTFGRQMDHCLELKLFCFLGGTMADIRLATKCVWVSGYSSNKVLLAANLINGT